jgi:hypothetical protein
MIEQVHEADDADGTQQGCPPGHRGNSAQAIVTLRAESVALSHER